MADFVVNMLTAAAQELGKQLGKMERCLILPENLGAHYKIELGENPPPYEGACTFFVMVYEDGAVTCRIQSEDVSLSFELKLPPDKPLEISTGESFSVPIKAPALEDWLNRFRNIYMGNCGIGGIGGSLKELLVPATQRSKRKKKS